MKTNRVFWLLLLFFGLSNLVFGQDVEDEDELLSWEDSPIFLHIGGNYSRISGSEYPTRFTYLPSGSGGIWLKYRLLQALPFYVGVEYLSKGYNIDLQKSGVTNSGKNFKQESKGRSRMYYLSFPVVFEIKLASNQKKLKALAGLAMDMRMFSYERFNYSYRIPSDSILIEGSELKYRNDAKDILDGMFTAGLNWKPHQRFEIWLTGSFKLFGLSLGKENFFNRTEYYQALNLRLFYQIARVRDIPFL